MIVKGVNLFVSFKIKKVLFLSVFCKIESEKRVFLNIYNSDILK